MNTIIIKDHIDEEKRKHREKVEQAEAAEKQIQTAIKEKTTLQSDLKTEKVRKETVLRQSEAEGLDVTKLRDKIHELDAQIMESEKALEKLRGFKDELQAVAARSFERHDLMVSVLTNVFDCKEALVIDGIAEAYKLLPVEITELDAAGRPSECTVSIARGHQIKLSVKSTDSRFWKNFRPKVLEWVSDDASNAGIAYYSQGHARRSARDVAERVRVFFDKVRDQIVLSQPLEWATKHKQSNYPYDEISEKHTDKFEGIARELATELKAGAQAEDNVVDLQRAYEEGSFFAHVRSELIAQTTSTPLFKENKEVLASAEVLKRIKAEWDAFVNCPWSEQVTGTLALLKYHVENGERPRFWNGAFENQYGFRVRTRDHDWIVGQLFVENTAEAAKPSHRIRLIEEGSEYSRSRSRSVSTQVVSLGKLYLNVWRDD